MPLKRSVVNASIRRAEEVFAHFGVALPPFAFWTPEDWLTRGADCSEIWDCMLGWDVTDFGSDDFTHIGRTLFTLRNGNMRDDRYPKSYAEKLLLDPEGQRAPAHFHRSKREDIICKAGGNVLLQLWPAGADDRPTEDDLELQVDGRTVRLDSGGIWRLRPGESLCIPPRTIHQFWGEEGTGLVIEGVGYTVSGEVSSVCDDLTDNTFLEAMNRFPRIEEDAPPYRHLCREYPAS